GEGGIRGFHVTGVQTCALPIYDAEGDRLTADAAGGQLERAEQREVAAAVQRLERFGRPLDEQDVTRLERNGAERGANGRAMTLELGSASVRGRERDRPGGARSP